jgi:hypothetical protein
MPAVSTMLPAGYGRKVRAEWTIVPEDPSTTVNIFNISDAGRSNEWADSLGAVDVTMGNNVLLASDGMRVFAQPANDGPAQLVTALDSNGDSYIELEVPGGETYSLSKHFVGTRTYAKWEDSTVGASIKRVSDGAVVDFSDTVRAEANAANLCIVRVKESPA